MKSTTEQIKILNKLFDLELKAKGEGYIIPHFKTFGSYNEAVEKVLAKIKETRPFFNWREGEISSEYLRQTKVKEKFWESQPNLIILDCQLGEKYKGKSVAEVRGLFEKNEIGLGSYEVGIILLTHPEILQKYEDLWIDCPGDEYSFAVGRFGHAPYFSFYDVGVGFGTNEVSSAHERYGSVSGFLPQSKLESRNLETLESLNLESAIKIVKKAGYKIFKEY